MPNVQKIEIGAGQGVATARKPIKSSKQRPLRILFARRDKVVVERCVEELRGGQYSVTSDVALTPAQFAQQVSSHRYDVVLAEYPNPEWRGPQPVELLHRTGNDIPLILLTRAIQPERMGEFLRKGVADCVETEGLALLELTVRRVLDAKALREQLNQAEKALRRSDAHYCALLENPTYGMCRCAMDGKFLNVNRALSAMLGYASREELLAMDAITNILQAPDDQTLLFDYCHRTNRAEPIEIGLKKNDGTILKVRLTAWIVRDEQGVAEGYEVIVEDVTGRRALEDQLRRQADSDPLTKLVNYRRLLEVLFAEIERSKRTGRGFAIALMDLDELKKVNDRYGHMEGNRALCRLADTMRNCCRSIDTAARFGGDEFALVLPETGAEAAMQVSRRIRDHLANSGEQPVLSVSFGVAAYPQDGDSIEMLLQSADRALYNMKGHQGSLF